MSANLVQVARDAVNQGDELQVSIAFVLKDKGGFVTKIAGAVDYYFR
jgi:hypothetical protein